MTRNTHTPQTCTWLLYLIKHQTIGLTGYRANGLLVHSVPMEYLFRHFWCRMYHLATIHGVTEGQMDRRQCHANSQDQLININQFASFQSKRITKWNSLPHSGLTAGWVVQSHMTTAVDQSQRLPLTSANRQLVQMTNATGCCSWLLTAVTCVAQLNNQIQITVK